MAQTQEYELKLAVSHHHTLKTNQLIEFLENESNEFLTNDFPHSITQDKFLTIFETLPSQSQITDYSEYVGLLLLYSSSSLESYEEILKNIPDKETLVDMFMIVIEMDNTDKKTNVIGDECERMCLAKGYQFVRLSLFNSENLVTLMHRNLYELIENYYYPNEEEKPSKKGHDSQYVFHYGSLTNLPQKDDSPHGDDKQGNLELISSIEINSPTLNASINSNTFSSPTKKSQKIYATKEEKRSVQKLLEKASQLRESRNISIFEEQKELDDSIANVEKILTKINENIDEKIKSNWYTNLNHTLYSPLEKNSVSFAKIKLTQEFVEDEHDEMEIPDFMKISKKRNLMNKSRNGQSSIQPGVPGRAALVNKFIAKHRKLEPILKILLTVTDEVIIELDVYEESEYDELALIGIRKLGITESEHNFKLMRKIISQRIEEFVRELSKAVKITEKIRIDERSLLKPNSNYDSLSGTKMLYRSNVSSSNTSQ